MNMSPIYDSTQRELPVEIAHALSRGKVISIKNPVMPAPTLSIIQRLEGACLYFRVSDDLLKSNIFLGDELTCHIIDDDNEYVMNGIIGNIEFNYPRELQFFIKTINIFKNLRKFRRYNVNFSAEIFLNQNHARAYSIVKNISTSDLNLVLKDKVGINDKVDVDILVNKDTVLKFKARVARIAPTKEYTECGMEITTIDDTNKDRLDQVIFQLMHDERLFVAESLR